MPTPAPPRLTPGPPFVRKGPIEYSGKAEQLRRMHPLFRGSSFGSEGRVRLKMRLGWQLIDEIPKQRLSSRSFAISISQNGGNIYLAGSDNRQGQGRSTSTTYTMEKSISWSFYEHFPRFVEIEIVTYKEMVLIITVTSLGQPMEVLKTHVKSFKICSVIPY